MKFLFVNIPESKATRVHADNLDDAWHVYLSHYGSGRRRGFGDFERAKEMLKYDIVVINEQTDMEEI